MISPENKISGSGNKNNITYNMGKQSRVKLLCSMPTQKIYAIDHVK